MKRKHDKNYTRALLKELLTVLLAAAFVFGVYKGVSYLRSIHLNRVYGKTVTRLEKQISDRYEWKAAVDNYEDDITAKPEDVEPYLVVIVDSERNLQSWDVLAWSGKDKTSLEGLKTVVLCKYSTKSASYGPAGSKTGTTRGTSEFVTLRYINAGTNECFLLESIGKELPGKTSDAPHYKVSYNKLLSHIKKTLEELEDQ